MIARNPQNENNGDIWSALAAPLPPAEIQWRQQGRPVARNGQHIARFVGYIDAQFVQERLDSIVPGEWDSHLEQLPNVTTFDGEEDAEPFAFKCRLQVLGVIREDVGTGKDYKTAATDAFKRAAVRFGIGRELYSLGMNYVPMDGDGKYAKPLEDPAVAYARRNGGQAASRPTTANSSPAASALPQPSNGAGESDEPSREPGPLASDEQNCPKCGGRMYDNRLTKRNPRAPDFKCRDRSCDGVVWPPKASDGAKPGRESDEGPHHRELEEIPF